MANRWFAVWSAIFRRTSWLYWLAPWLVAAVALAFYLPLLDRYFTSEDFLLVRFLAENPPWRNLPALFCEPWLQISVVKFWRPVSTMLYGLEVAAFGANPTGYNLIHILVHACNSMLVWSLARQLSRGNAVAPLGAGLLFAIYPLHPNAVIWGAGFATLFAAMFVLAAMHFYLKFRETGSRLNQALSLGLFALGLGSYESTAVLPPVLATYDHLQAGRRHMQRVAGYLPFFVLLGFYFLLRKSLFGVFVGGYEEKSHSLTAPQIGPLFRDLMVSIYQLHVPVYDQAPGTAAAVIICFLVLALPLAMAWRVRSLLRPWLFGWVWTLAAMAPFAFEPSVPGNGRYWYLAVAGVSLSLASLARAHFMVAVAVGLLGLTWGVELSKYLGVYSCAGQTSRQIQQDLLVAKPADLRFLHCPAFLTNERGVPIAQVYHYGLWDALHSPFVNPGVPVYPLPKLVGAELLPLLRGAPGCGIYTWDDGRLQVVPTHVAGVEPAELETDGFEVKVAPGFAKSFRLIVVARGNWAIVELGSEARVTLPKEFCQTMVQLYGDHEMFWWLEARDNAKRLVGFTRLRGFRPEP